MKKLLLAIVIVVGCDYAPTEHTHTDGICPYPLGFFHRELVSNAYQVIL